MNALEERIKRLEERMDVLEGRGFICAGCKIKRPGNYFWYTATNPNTGEVVSPLCAPCVRGDANWPFCEPPWKHAGPFSQPVTKP